MPPSAHTHHPRTSTHTITHLLLLESSTVSRLSEGHVNTQSKVIYWMCPARQEIQHLISRAISRPLVASRQSNRFCCLNITGRWLADPFINESEAALLCHDCFFAGSPQQLMKRNGYTVSFDLICRASKSIWTWRSSNVFRWMFSGKYFH